MTNTNTKITSLDDIFQLIAEDYEGGNGFVGAIQNSRKDKFKLVLMVASLIDGKYINHKDTCINFNENWKLCVLDKDNIVVQSSPKGYPVLGQDFSAVNSNNKNEFKLITVYCNNIDEANILINHFNSDLKHFTYEEIILDIANFVVSKIEEEAKDITIQGVIDTLTDEQTDDVTLPTGFTLDQEVNSQRGYQSRDSRLTAIQRQLQANKVEIKKQEAILNEAKMQLLHLRSMQQVLKDSVRWQ